MNTHMMPHIAQNRVNRTAHRICKAFSDILAVSKNRYRHSTTSPTAPAMIMGMIYGWENVELPIVKRSALWFIRITEPISAITVKIRVSRITTFENHSAIFCDFDIFSVFNDI